MSGVVAVGSAGSFLGCQRHLGGRGAAVWTRPSLPKSCFLTFLPAPTANKTPELGALRKAEAVVTIHHPALFPPGSATTSSHHVRSATRRPTAHFPVQLWSLWHWGRCSVAETGFMPVFFFVVVVAFPSSYGHTGTTGWIRAMGPSGSVACCDKCPVHAAEEGRARNVWVDLIRWEINPCLCTTFCSTAIIQQMSCALCGNKAMKWLVNNFRQEPSLPPLRTARWLFIECMGVGFGPVWIQLTIS